MMILKGRRRGGRGEMETEVERKHLEMRKDNKNMKEKIERLEAEAAATAARNGG